tara:strand:+ start:153754 stop:154323 length:570 start_codon:yes stop_codon:yes gene_type:complete
MKNYDKDINDLLSKQEKSNSRFESVKKVGGQSIGLAGCLLAVNMIFNINADPEKYEALSEELDKGTLTVPRSFYIESDLTTCVRDKTWSNVEGADPQSFRMSDKQAEDLLKQFPGHFAHCVGGDLPPTEEIKENYVNQYKADNTLMYLAFGSIFAGAMFILSGATGGAVSVLSTRRSIKEKQDMKNLLK